MPQTDTALYRGGQPAAVAGDHAEDSTDQAITYTGRLAAELGAAVKERPFTTLAITGGLAFAIGALWKLSRRPTQSRYERLLTQLPQLPDSRSLQKWVRAPNLQNWLPRG
jgi:hypothetical protein